MSGKKKILIIRFSSIGDIVLCSPILRCLRKQTDAELHFLVKEKFAGFMRPNPNIDRIWTIKKSVFEIVEELEKEGFSFVVDLQRNIRSARLIHELKCPNGRFPKVNIKKWLLVSFKWDLMPDVHVVDRYFEAVKDLDVSNDGKGLDFFIDEGAEKRFLSKVSKQNKYWKSAIDAGDYLVFSLGATWATKRMPISKSIELIKSIKGNIILVGGDDVKREGEKLLDSNPQKVLNLCGKLDLFETATLLKKAKYLITFDTGIMHIGAALKIPMHIFWGNTVPSFGMYPYYGDKSFDRIKMSEVNDLKCRPCSKIGYNRCPKKHFRCMIDHNLSEIGEVLS